MTSFKGLNGTILLKENSLSIIRESGIDTTFHKKGVIEISYSCIDGVMLELGSLVNGYITIIEKGSTCPSSIFSAMKNDNTVIFRCTKNGQAEKIRALIEKNI